MDAIESILLAASIASGLGFGLLSIAGAAHVLVGAAREPAARPPCTQSPWAARVDPDHLLPPPLDRVAPPRERGPGGAS